MKSFFKVLFKNKYEKDVFIIFDKLLTDNKFLPKINDIHNNEAIFRLYGYFNAERHSANLILIDIIIFKIYFKIREIFLEEKNNQNRSIQDALLFGLFHFIQKRDQLFLPKFIQWKKEKLDQTSSNFVLHLKNYSIQCVYNNIVFFEVPDFKKSNINYNYISRFFITEIHNNEEQVSQLCFELKIKKDLLMSDVYLALLKLELRSFKREHDYIKNHVQIHI